MRLNALQHSTPMLPGRSQPKKETAFKLSGSFKPAALPSDDRYTVNAKDMVRIILPHLTSCGLHIMHWFSFNMLNTLRAINIEAG